LYQTLGNIPDVLVSPLNAFSGKPDRFFCFPGFAILNQGLGIILNIAWPGNDAGKPRDVSRTSGRVKFTGFSEMLYQYANIRDTLLL
jgi:hypothetical protein